MAPPKVETTTPPLSFTLDPKEYNAAVQRQGISEPLAIDVNRDGIMSTADQFVGIRNPDFKSLSRACEVVYKSRGGIPATFDISTKAKEALDGQITVGDFKRAGIITETPMGQTVDVRIPSWSYSGNDTIPIRSAGGFNAETGQCEMNTGSVKLDLKGSNLHVEGEDQAGKYSVDLSLDPSAKPEDAIKQTR